MAKVGNVGATSIQPTTTSTVKQQSVVSPQDKKVTFTGKQAPQEQQVREQGQRPAEKQVKRQDSPVNQGNFQILSAKDGKYSIRLTNVSQNIAFGRLSMRDLSAHLAKLNMPMTESNLKLAKSLLEFKMPLTKENLQDVKTALAMMTQKTDGDVQAGVFMKMKSMGITPENAKALQTLFAKNPELGKQLENLQKMAGFFAAAGGHVLNDSMMSTLMSQVASMFGDLIPEPNKDKKLAKKIKDLAEEVGIDDEESNIGQMKKSGKQSARKSLSRLKQKLNDKVSNLRGYIPKDQEEILEETAELIRELDENLEAQRLINNAPSVDDDNFIYLQIPLKMGSSSHTVHLMLDYEYDLNGQKVVNPKNTRLVFSIQTEDMGIINIIMNIWRRNISFHLETERQEIKQHINKKAPDLIKKLRDRAYKVGNWDCVVDKNVVSVPDTLLKKEEEFAELATLDVTI